MSKKSKIILTSFLFVFVATLTFLGLKFPRFISAASLANFDPGNIISDYAMSNVDSMTLEEIDAFLKAKGNCRNTDTYKASWYTSVSYHIEDGHFVCLAEERFGDGVIYGANLPEGEGQTAAEVIYDVSHEYNINPHVLIVLLEKEQGLITDSWPNSRQYKVATGYGCPDTAPCNEKYYGFKNQLKKAAELFRIVLDGGWTNYPLGENYIYYNPNRDCGGSVVNIQNLATSSLYRYTPYQPNAGALAAGYGTASCGAYGNRNFYLYFSDWFGNPTDPGVKQITLDDIEKVDLEDGTYNIFYSGDDNRTINIENVGTNIQVATFSSSDASNRWKIEKSIEGFYIIINEQSNKALDVSGGTFINKANVQQYTINSSCAQQWIFGKGTSENIVIYNYCNPNFVLDLQNGDKNVQIYKKTENFNEHQEWQISPAKELALVKDWSGSYIIKYFEDTNKILTLSSQDDYSNIQIGQSSKFSQLSQWTIKKIDDYYIIINNKTNMLLDVSGGIFENKRNIWQHGQNLTCAQRWNFTENQDDTITIHNACSPNFVLDVADGISNVQIYTDVGNEHQKWSLETAPDAEDFSGVYNILYSGAQTQTIGVDYGTENIQTFEYDANKKSQMWSVEYIDDYYIIKNLATKKLIDISGGAIANKTNIWQYKSNNSCAQRWLFDRNSDQSVTVKNACDDTYVLDLADGKTNVQIYSKTNYDNAHQKWILRPATSDRFSGLVSIVYGADKTKTLSVASEDDYANIELTNGNDASSQWTIKKIDDYYIIINNKTNMLLDVSGGIFENKRNIWQHGQNLTCAQRWNFTENQDDTITIHNACSPNFVLDVADGISNVQIYTDVGNEHQKWKIFAL